MTSSINFNLPSGTNGVLLVVLTYIYAPFGCSFAQKRIGWMPILFYYRFALQFSSVVPPIFLLNYIDFFPCWWYNDIAKPTEYF